MLAYTNGYSSLKRRPEDLSGTPQMFDSHKMYVFTMPNDKPVNCSWILKHRRKFQDKYPELKKWRLHDFRHSFAWNFLRNGGEMYQLQSILGHKSIRLTVDLYGHFKAADVKIASPYEF
jgi:site-specific recombinase XerD